VVISDRTQQIKIIDDLGNLLLGFTFYLGSQQQHIQLKDLLQSSLYLGQVLVTLVMRHPL